MELELKQFQVNSDQLEPTRLMVSDEVFDYPFNSSLIHQVVSNYQINARKGTSAQKNRSEVSGSKKKPWKQKGTGRARSGSIKSPIWRSGGVTFASKPYVYNKKINRKMYKGAIKSILSKLIRDNRLFLIDNFFLEAPKTKLFLKKLKQITFEKSVLIFFDIIDTNVILAARNVHTVKVYKLTQLNPVSLLNFRIIFFTRSAINKIEQQLL